MVSTQFLRNYNLKIPYSGLFSRRLYFANFAKAQPILENKNLERQLMWEEAWFSISIREITFREQELNCYSRNINASKITRYTVHVNTTTRTLVVFYS